MKQFEIQGRMGRSVIRIGASLADVADLVRDRCCILVTDENVRRYHGSAFPPFPVIQIGTGESIKTMATLAAVYEQLVALQADRSTFLRAVGGGIVCDIAGFAASTYMRGLRFGFVASTLLAQVDASVGGKNGVNFQGYKNMVGVFNQPEFVICDLALLGTLPRREVLCGLAETVKHAAIADRELFDYLAAHTEAALAGDAAVMERAVFDSVVIKSAVVNADEHEKGERIKLNFGHTVGHAVEKLSGIPHGEAVSIGMCAAADISVRLGRLSRDACRELKDLLTALGLPTTTTYRPSELLEALRRDKKRQADRVRFVLLADIGRAEVVSLTFEELSDLLTV